VHVPLPASGKDLRLTCEQSLTFWGPSALTEGGALRGVILLALRFRS
jgi:hypothetical protein